MAKIPELADYHISAEYGFLLKDPLDSLPEYFAPWENAAKNIATLLEEKKLRETVKNMPLLDHTKLSGYKEIRYGYTCLSYITNGYVWQEGDKGVVDRLPRQISIPLTALAEYLGTKPGLCLTTFMLSNWKKIDPKGPLHYSNLDIIIKFTKGPDLLNFMKGPFQTELATAPALQACVDALKAVVADDKSSAIKALQQITKAMVDMEAYFDMFKHCEPDYFYYVLGPLLSGWGGETSVLPNGLIYEGVSTEPKKLFSTNFGQGATVYVFDATLGIKQNKAEQQHMDDIMMCMPFNQREFIIAMRNGPSLKEYVKQKNDSDLTDAYNSAVSSVVEFRSSHIRLVARQVLVPSKNEAKFKAAIQVTAKKEEIPVIVDFLKGTRDGTSSHILS